LGIQKNWIPAKNPPAKSASPFAKGDKGGFKTEQKSIYSKYAE
jgi:hypothetical protein